MDGLINDDINPSPLGEYLVEPNVKGFGSINVHRT